MQNQSQDIQQPLCVDCVCAPLSNYYAHEVPPPSLPLSLCHRASERAPSSLLSATYAIYHSLDYLARSLLLSSPVKISISSSSAAEPSFLVVLGVN